MKTTLETTRPSDLTGSPDVAANFASAIGGAISPVMESIVGDAQSATKYAFIASAYQIDHDGPLSWVIRNSHPLYNFLEKDTRPHVISAVNGPYLMFMIGGHFVKVPSVNHPGTTGEYAFRSAWERGVPAAREEGRTAFAWWLSSVGAQGAL